MGEFVFALVFAAFGMAFVVQHSRSERDRRRDMVSLSLQIKEVREMVRKSSRAVEKVGNEPTQMAGMPGPGSRNRFDY